jgi:hypothetical protein
VGAEIAAGSPWRGGDTTDGTDSVSAMRPWLGFAYVVQLLATTD